jgi:hypothetical protein
MTVVVGARNLFKADAGVVHALLNSRYYDSSRGQFVSEDPVFRALGNNDQVKQLTQRETAAFLADPQQMNSYGYGRDNPVLIRDPNGLASMFSKDPLLATLELYGYVSIARDVNAYFSKGRKPPATQNSQTAQLQLDGALGTAGFLATETEGAVLTVARFFRVSMLIVQVILVRISPIARRQLPEPF